MGRADSVQNDSGGRFNLGVARRELPTIESGDEEWSGILSSICDDVYYAWTMKKSSA